MAELQVTFRPLVWTDPSTKAAYRRGRWTFKAGLQDTLTLLRRELGYLNARSVVIQAGLREQDIRMDGFPRSGAKAPDHPGVKIAFDSKHGPLTYATDTHEWWEHNIRAIALGLEALRAVDRYGVTKSGEQYRGWKQLPASSSSNGTMTRTQAAEFIVDNTEPGRITSVADLCLAPDDPRPLILAYHSAARRLHPDFGGDTVSFQRLQEAMRVLEASS